MVEWLTSPWPWYVGGPLIALSMFIMIFSGKRFGISSTLDAMCSVGGAGKISSYFNFNWRDHSWNFLFVVGTIIGGYIAATWMTPDRAIALNPDTVIRLQLAGITSPGADYLPEIFAWENLFTMQGFIFMILGGFMVGFGTRYAGGCTSGHAISGLSNLQLPSLIATIGFFIGGLIATHFILPVLL
ncbi:MAG: YeeE/YedE family protein [Cyclobacteriaceae bacterium]